VLHADGVLHAEMVLSRPRLLPHAYQREQGELQEEESGDGEEVPHGSLAYDALNRPQRFELVGGFTPFGFS
jgi:hypothetical protein